jgi:hypothetical protein
MQIFSIFIVRQFGIPGKITRIFEVLYVLRSLCVEIVEGIFLAINIRMLA